MKKFYILLITIPIFILTTACILTYDNAGYVAKMQKVTPFTIVIPTYLPQDFQKVPIKITPPIKNELTGALEIDIGYLNRSTIDHYIEITEEENKWQATVGISGPVYKYLTINEIDVLEQETTSESMKSSPSGFILAHGLMYSWRSQEIVFLVRVFGYSTDECRKIVESMINQSATYHQLNNFSN